MQNAPLADVTTETKPAPTSAAETPLPLLARGALAALSAGLLWAALPPLGFAPLALVALAPFLLALRGLTPTQATRLGFFYGYVGAAANAHWFLNVFPVHVNLALWGVIAIFPAVYGSLHARFARSGPVVLALAAPAAWLAIDWFRSELWPLKFAWFTLGHALGGNSVLRQNADIAGVYGLTLVGFLTSFALERAFAFRKDGRAFVLALLVLGANAALFARGNRVLGFTPKTEARSLSVLAIQDEHPDKLEPKQSLTVGAIGTQPPDVIVWPEDSFFVDWTRGPHAKTLRAIAGLSSQAFVFGSLRDLPDGKARNCGIVLSPTGALIGEYDKRVPVQFMEGAIVPGTQSPVFQVPGAKLGVMICYDGTYPFVARDLVHAGAEVILVPTMDMKHWGRVQHEHHALFYALRACELRRPIVRAASSGVTMALDAWGRTIKRLEPFDPGALRAVVHPNDARTPYSRGGWLLPAFASAIALAGLARTFKR